MLRQRAARESYGKIFHAGNEADVDWVVRAKSWDEAKMFQATPAGRRGETRNLTGGALPWCTVGAMEGTMGPAGRHRRRESLLR